MTSPRDILKKLHAEGLVDDKKDIVDISVPQRLGVTNQYSFISVNGKSLFIYRIAGKQWDGGFDRHTELYNLNIVIMQVSKQGLYILIRILEPKYLHIVNLLKFRVIYLI